MGVAGTLSTRSDLTSPLRSDTLSRESSDADVILTAPGGKESAYSAKVTDEYTALTIDIDNPVLWECNGMSDREVQPLYNESRTKA